MYSSTHNEKGLDEIERVQEETRRRLDNTTRMLAETDEVGGKTTEELRRQGDQLKQIREDVDVLNDNVNRSNSLLNRFDRWNFTRTNQSKVTEEAKAEVARQKATPLEHRMVYENQRFDPLTRTWKEAFLPSDPSGFVHPDGTTAASVLDAGPAEHRWKVDFSEREVDAEGWSYAFDFAAFAKGRNTRNPAWNDFVRRRKWKYDPYKQSDVVSRVQERYGQTGQSEAVPRSAGAHYTSSRVGAPAPDPALTQTLFGPGRKGVDTGYKSANGWESMTTHEQERLRRTERQDKEIDDQVDQIGRMLDSIGAHARNINSEVKAQNATIAEVEKGIDNASLGVAKVNTRVGKHLR